MANEPSGWLTISIDLEMALEKRARREHRAMEVAARRLLQAFDEHQVVGAWAVADPAHSAATELILGSRGSHEIAVLGDPTWVGRGAGRTRFSRELQRRIEGARAAGISISTLALQDTELDEHLDLLVKHRISVLRGSEETAASDSNSSRSRWKRFGLWRPPVACKIPCDRPWWQGGNVLAVRRTLHRAAASGAFAHVVVDGSRLIEAGESGFSSIMHLLRDAQRRVMRGQLVVTTISQLASQYAQRQPRHRARSIMRPAA